MIKQQRNGIFISYPDGTSAKYSMFSFFPPQVKDGSVITVNTKEQVEPFSFTEYVTNFTQFMQI